LVCVGAIIEMKQQHTNIVSFLLLAWALYFGI
jgi:hypothetical protein